MVFSAHGLPGEVKRRSVAAAAAATQEQVQQQQQQPQDAAKDREKEEDRKDAAQMIQQQQVPSACGVSTCSSQQQSTGLYVKATTHCCTAAPTGADDVAKTHSTTAVDGRADWHELLRVCPAVPKNMALTLSLRRKAGLLRRTGGARLRALLWDAAAA